MAVTVQGFKERQTAGETCKSNCVCEARTQSNCAREEHGPQSAGGERESKREQACMRESAGAERKEGNKARSLA